MRWYSYLFQDGTPVFLHPAGYIKSARLLRDYVGIVNAIDAEIPWI